MSKISIHKVTCPICHKEQEIEKYDSVNDYDHKLFEKVADGSIFDYKCKECEATVRDPHPFLFHKLGINDVMIGYKITPILLPDSFKSPLVTVMRDTMNLKDVSERYDDLDSFTKRVKEILKKGAC
ncbi:MAG: hypothetical protein IJZ27_04270 [Treponema sp.]|nr:hypothetical protein [Treponema sp.]